MVITKLLFTSAQYMTNQVEGHVLPTSKSDLVRLTIILIIITVSTKGGFYVHLSMPRSY